MKKGLRFIFIVAVIYWGYYFTKPLVTGKKISASIEKTGDVVHESNLNILEISIEIFCQKEGRYPERLNELVEKGYLTKLPDSGSRDWGYDHADGLVN